MFEVAGFLLVAVVCFAVGAVVGGLAYVSGRDDAEDYDQIDGLDYRDLPTGKPAGLLAYDDEGNQIRVEIVECVPKKPDCPDCPECDCFAGLQTATPQPPTP